MNIKQILKITLALTLTFTMLVTTGFVSNATKASSETEYENEDELITQPEEVKTENPTEKLDSDTKNNIDLSNDDENTKPSDVKSINEPIIEDSIMLNNDKLDSIMLNDKLASVPEDWLSSIFYVKGGGTYTVYYRKNSSTWFAQGIALQDEYGISDKKVSSWNELADTAFETQFMSEMSSSDFKDIYYADIMMIHQVLTKQYTINGVKAFHNFDYNGNSGDGIALDDCNPTTKTPIIKVSGNVAFDGGFIYSTDSQMSTNYRNITYNGTGSRPIFQINSGGILNIKGGGVTAGENAPYVIENKGTFKTSEATSIMGAANSNKSCPLIKNSGTLELYQAQCYLSYTDDGKRNSCVVENTGKITTTNSTRIGNAVNGIVNDGKGEISGDICGDIHGNTENGILTTEKATGTVTITGGTIYSNLTGINNNSKGTFTVKSGTIKDNWVGIYNASTFTMSGGEVTGNITGIKNDKTSTMTNGNVKSNSYGIENLDTFNHNGGTVSNNNGPCPASDTVKVGVYQGGTYNISGSAKVTGNSIHLIDNEKRVNVTGSFTGNAVITTDTSDRTIGRELVTNGDKYASKFSLAYGNYNGKTNAYKVKDSDGVTFTGNNTAIRGGSNIKGVSPTSSAYLSGNYSLKYSKNISNPTSPSSYLDTTFYWQEDFTAKFGTNKFTKADDNKYSYEFLGYDLDATASYPEHTSDETFNLIKGATYYAIWNKDLLVKDMYHIHYNYNNGYGDAYTQDVYCGQSATYISAPSRYTSATITYDYAYDNKVNTEKVTKSFDGWTKSGTSTPVYQPGASFKDIASKDETVHMWGNWSVNPITLPNISRDEYELVGWEDEDGDILPPGTQVTPEGDKPITYTAVWSKLDHTIIYNPNGAVDTYGNSKDLIITDGPEFASTPITLIDGTVAGGIKMEQDTVYTAGYINNALSSTYTINPDSLSIQYKAKRGDILNNLGNSNTLAKFTGWTKVKDTNPAYNGTVTLTDNNLWGASAKNTKVFTFYAKWDNFPGLIAPETTLENQSALTKERLLKSVYAEDTEDGNITNKVTVINYNEIVKAFNEGSSAFTAIYEVTDSAGNTTRSFATIKMADDYDGKALNVITHQVRTINRHAYDTKDASLGGCLEGSPWYSNPSYVATMNSGFDNMDNNTPIVSYTITKDERVEISDYIHNIGLTKMHEKSTLNFIVNNYMNNEHKNKAYNYSDKTSNLGSNNSITIKKSDMEKREELELNRLSELRNNMNLSRIYR